MGRLVAFKLLIYRHFADTGICPLTPNIDTFTTQATGAIFNALPFVQSSGLANNTLNTGDNLQDSNNDGTLNYTASPNGVAANPPFALGVTLNGIATTNITNQSHAVAGFQGDVTGLTVVNDTASVAGVRLGGLGQGLNTALTNVNIKGFGGAPSNVTPVFNGIIATSAGSATNTIKIGLTGPLGATALAGAAALQFTNDGGPGTAANPNLSYGTWAITTANNVDLQLQQGGVGAATTLTLSGAGNIAVGQDAQGNWQKVTTIDASGETGTVVVTGASSQNTTATQPITGLVVQTNALASAANPGWLFGSNAGLLDDTGATFALTSFKLGSGTNFLDISSATLAEVAKLTTTPGTLVALNNEIIVNDAVATTVSATTFAHISGFEILGVTGASGTIDMANLPAAIGTILYQTPATGGVTINDVTSTLTVNTEANGFDNTLTIGASGPNPGFNDTLNVIVGDAMNHTPGSIGAVTVFGEENVNFTSQGAVTATVPISVTHANLIGTVLLTPTITGSEHVTISGDTDIAFGISGGGSIFSVNAAGNFNVDNLSITDTNALGTIFAAPLQPPTPIDITTYSTNAALIDATKSGTGGTVGLIMQGGDANWHSDGSTGNTGINGNDAGDTISGSLTSGNILIGSLGNDTINGNTSNAADTIATDGGADTINLAANHSASDHVDLFVGFSVANFTPGTALTAVANSILSTGGAGQQGFWGNSPGTTGGLPALVFTGSGTSADLSTINNFNPGPDVIDLSINAWGSSFLGDSQFTSLTTAANGGNAVFTNSVGPGGTVTSGAGADVLFIGQGSFLNAATLAGVLASASGGITFKGSALANGNASDIIVAYDNLQGNTVIADLQIYNASGGALTNVATNTKGVDIAVSDMAVLTGVNPTHLAGHDIHFVG